MLTDEVVIFTLSIFFNHTELIIAVYLFGSDCAGFGSMDADHDPALLVCDPTMTRVGSSSSHLARVLVGLERCLFLLFDPNIGYCSIDQYKPVCQCWYVENKRTQGALDD